MDAVISPRVASKPLIDLTSVNPEGPDGTTSRALDFDEADAADPATVNAILYRYAAAHKPHA